MKGGPYRTTFATLRALMLVLLVIAGSAVPTMAQSGRFAQLRVVNTSFDTAAIDVYLGGRKMIASLGFKGVSRLLTLLAGSQSISVTGAGRREKLVDANVDLQSGKTYTLITV